jgi:hypothetical protein
MQVPDPRQLAIERDGRRWPEPGREREAAL